ncbi:MAG: hypothetical protein ACI8SR_000599 [Oceanicoccus sp.]|jgi:hypothetical protein
MIKKILLIALLFSSCVWADNNTQSKNELNKQVEDDEIIGGIGGTGLHDMERPELLERPEIDIDSVLESVNDNGVDMSPDIDFETDRPE